MLSITSRFGLARTLILSGVQARPSQGTFKTTTSPGGLLPI